MLFASYPSQGYTPPPRSTNPIVIVLGVCGGCAAIAIIAGIAVTMFSMKQPLFQRSMATGQFIAALTTHKYDAAESQLAAAAQASFPAEKLRKTEEGFEAQYGPYQRFSQSGMDITNQRDPNSLSEISYKLHYQHGSSNITLHFDTTGNGRSNKIAAIEWDGGDGVDSPGSLGGDKQKPGHKGAKNGD